MPHLAAVPSVATHSQPVPPLAPHGHSPDELMEIFGQLVRDSVPHISHGVWKKEARRAGCERGRTPMTEAVAAYVVQNPVPDRGRRDQQ